MKCFRCNSEFQEKDLQLSHDIPKYLGGTDLDGRHYLCKKHHEEYEDLIIEKCLETLGEDFIKEERIQIMKALSALPEPLKKEFRKTVCKIKEGWFDDP